jgi:hypothetical protein
LIGRVPRTYFIEHDQRQIVLMDFSQLLTPQEGLQAIEEARQFIAAQPKRRNLLTLVDVTGSTQDTKVIDALSKLAEHDKPWVIAGAVVGVSMIWRMLFRMVTMMSGRKLASFTNQQDAKEWLVKQWTPPSSVPDIMR